MAREEYMELVPAFTVEAHTLPCQRIKCDGCGRPLTDDHQGTADDASILYIILYEGDCVSFPRVRDYCNTCLVPIWKAISKLIGADPDVEREDLE
jgi:hypothetical protein